MKPPPLRPLLPPPAIRRRQQQQNPSIISYSSVLAPLSVSAHSSSTPYTTCSPPAPPPAYFPAIYCPTLSAVHRTKYSNNNLQNRGYAIQTPSPLTLQVFNAATKHRQRERTASNAEASRRVDYLRDEVATRLCERLLVRISDSSLFYSFCFAVGGTHSIPSASIMGNLGYQASLPAYPRPRR